MKSNDKTGATSHSVVIPILLVRHNITIADRGLIPYSAGDKLDIINRFGHVSVNFTTNGTPITSSDTKTFISVCSLIHEKMQQDKDREWESQLLKNGISLSLKEILIFRGIKKEGGAYRKITESIQKFYNISLYSKEIWISLTEKQQIETYFRYINAFKVISSSRNQIVVEIYPSAQIIQSLLYKPRLISVDKSLLFSLDGLVPFQISFAT